ncbi:MAG: STAS domain-containing protein [Clostridia bacterium]|nr:STAS domain-containing protein [Clostridia bacterium]
MLDIQKTKEGENLLISVSGRLDTTTSPELETIIKEEMADTSSLTIDMENLEYISSAGLRVLLLAQKAMNEKDGKMVVKKPNDVIREIFEMTGFMDFLTVE